MAQLSTSFSDLILTVSCLYCLRILTSYSNGVHLAYVYSKLGFILIMIAASLGVFRFGMSFPPVFLLNCHRYTSFLASVLGMSCLAAEFYQQTRLPLYGQVHLFLSLLVITLQWFVGRKIHSILTEFVSSAAVISILVVCCLNRNVLGCMGAIAVITEGLLLGKQLFLGFPADDFFHYMLVLANWLLVHALTV